MATINEAIRICKRIILSNLLTNDYNIAVTPLLSGRHGIGKSQVAKAIAKSLNGVCITIEGGTLKEGEITGIPYQYRNDRGEIEFRFLPYYAVQRIQTAEKAVCNHEKNASDLDAILRGNENRYASEDLSFNEKVDLIQSGRVKPVILFFDEINRTDIAVFRELMNIILTRTVNGYRFPWWVFIIAAMNPSSQDSLYATNEMDPAQLDRFIKLKVQGDAGEWLDFAIENDFDNTIVEFISNHREALLQEGYELDDTDKPTPSPRGWNMVDIILKGRGKVDQFFSPIELKHEESDLHAIISAKVGSDAAVMYFASLKDNSKLILAEDLFADLGKELTSGMKLQISEQSTARNAITTKSVMKYLKENIQELINDDVKMERILERLSTYVKLIDDSSKLLFLSSAVATPVFGRNDVFNYISDIVDDELMDILQYRNLNDVIISRM